MKPYTYAIDIDTPRDRVLELLDDIENLYFWQEGLQSTEQLSGEPGQEGARMKMVFKTGKCDMVLEETITKLNLPDEMDIRYEWPGGWNSIQNRFIELGPDRCRWDATCEFSFEGLGMRLMGTLAPFFFKRQSLKYARAFKAFCETGADVRDKNS